MADTPLLIERQDTVTWVTINRPQALNALDPVTIAALQDCCAAAAVDDSVRCLVLSGAGERAFVAGADITVMANMSPREARAFARRGQELMRQIEELPLPVIAAVNGVALGGGLELALACDFIVAAETARFGQPEINLGIIPGFGGTQRLARRAGVAAARALIFTGDPIGAAEALRLGLVYKVVAAGELRAAAAALAATLAAKAPVALRQAKAVINLGSEIDLDDGCRYEADAFAATFATADRSEGMRAFLEKRRPAFRGA